MKTICIYHSRDLDGWMSAAIVKKWFLTTIMPGDIKTIEEYNKTHNPENDPLQFLGWDYGDEIPDLSKYDKVIMVDINFPSNIMYNVTHDIEIVWIDHHVSAINDMNSMWKEHKLKALEGLRDVKFAACELTWKYFFPNEEMPEIVRLLGRYDCFGHKGTDEEQKVLEFQYGARAIMSNYEECYEELQFEHNGISPIEDILDNGSAIYKYLCAEAKQIYDRAFPFEFAFKFKDDGNAHTMKDRVPITFLCVNQERFNPINFGIDYHKDGYDGFACFWYKDGKWTFSLYNDNGEVDCSEICKGYGGGGHKGAAGFVCKELPFKV